MLIEFSVITLLCASLVLHIIKYVSHARAKHKVLSGKYIGQFTIVFWNNKQPFSITGARTQTGYLLFDATSNDWIPKDMDAFLKSIDSKCKPSFYFEDVK